MVEPREDLVGIRQQFGFVAAVNVAHARLPGCEDVGDVPQRVGVGLVQISAFPRVWLLEVGEKVKGVGERGFGRLVGPGIVVGVVE